MKALVKVGGALILGGVVLLLVFVIGLVQPQLLVISIALAAIGVLVGMMSIPLSGVRRFEGPAFLSIRGLLYSSISLFGGVALFGPTQH